MREYTVAVRALVACAVAIAISISIHPTADAEGVGVVSVSTSDRTASAAAMTGVLASRGERIVDDALGEARRAMAAGAVPIEALSRFRRVRELVDEGWRAYLRVAGELAASRLDRPLSVR